MQKLSRDVNVIQGVCRMMLETGLGFIVFFFGTFLLVLWKAPLISLVFLAVIVCTALMHHFFHRRLEANSRRLRESFYQEGDTLYGLLEMLPTLSLFGVTRLFKPLFLSSTQQLAENQIRQQKGVIHFNALFQAETWAVHSVVLVVCTWLFLQGGLQVGDIVMYDMLIAQMLGGVSQLMSVLPQLDMGLEYARSLQELLFNEKNPSPAVTSLDQSSWNEKDKGASTLFRFRSVTFRYAPDKPPVISEFSTEIHEREFLCFLGRNGSGKSTLAKLMTGIYAPNAGEIHSFHRKVATVPQHIVIYKDTLLENVRLRDRNLSEALVKSILLECGFLRFFDKHPQGIQTEITPGSLSGGELQILGIARALVRRPDVLILDELTNNLDIVAKETIYTLLNAQRQRCTIVLITHDLSCVDMADRIFVFHHRGISELQGPDVATRNQQALEMIKAEGDYE